jgi:plastocyanin
MERGDHSTATVTRRTFLRTAGGATAAAATAGAAAGQDEETTTEGDGTPENGTETEGTPGETTEGGGGDGGGETVEVVVGPGGDFVFEPGTDEPLQIQPGTTVRFVWDSNTHNIVVDSQPDDAEWEGHETIEDEGFEYEFTFEVEGTYEYYCEPHRSQGMEATIEVSQDAGSDGGAETHTVDMTDDLVFDPEDITIAPGDTVVWENVGETGHTVTAYEDEIPDDAEYFASGGFDSEQAARDGYPDEGDIPGGESYEHTFETEGEFGYFCIPHESAGMVGSVTVQEGGGDGRGEGAARPTIPAAAKTLGIISASAMLSVLALAYVFLKYGGDYGEVET